MILMKNLPDEITIQRRSQQLLKSLSEPVHLEGTPSITVGASIGVALQREGDKADDWLQAADAAMYLAKERGKNRIVFANTNVTPPE